MTHLIPNPEELVLERPDISHLVTEDDTPVDNILSEKQQRLLTNSGYASWQSPTGKRSLLMANVGYFYAFRRSPIVPDVLLSIDVDPPDNLLEKHNRSYFQWDHGKAPDLVVEIVSNKKGNELGTKKTKYAQLGIPHYVVYDPMQQLSKQTLHVFELVRGSYVPVDDWWLERLNIGVTLWEGVFEDVSGQWLRWCDADGNVLLTGEELADLEAEARADAEERANMEATARAVAEERTDLEIKARLEAQQRADAEAKARQEAEKRAEVEAAARASAENELARLRAELVKLRGESL